MIPCAGSTASTTRAGLSRRPGPFPCGPWPPPSCPPGHAGEVIGAEPEHDCSAYPVGGPEPSRETVISATRSVSSSSGVLRPRPRARWVPIDRRRRRPAPASDLGCGRAREVPADSRPRTDERASLEGGDLRHGCDRPSVEFGRGGRPDAHSRSTGSGWRNSSSPSAGTTSSPSGLATPLATLARNLSERPRPSRVGGRFEDSRLNRTGTSSGVPGSAARRERGTPRQ